MNKKNKFDLDVRNNIDRNSYLDDNGFSDKKGAHFVKSKRDDNASHISFERGATVKTPKEEEMELIRRQVKEQSRASSTSNFEPISRPHSIYVSPEESEKIYNRERPQYNPPTASKKSSNHAPAHYSDNQTYRKWQESDSLQKTSNNISSTSSFDNANINTANINAANENTKNRRTESFKLKLDDNVNFEIRQPKVGTMKGASPMQKREAKYRERYRSRVSRWFFRILWFLFLFIIVSSISFYAIYSMSDLLAFSRQVDVKIVTIELDKNSDIDTIANKLKNAGVIKSVDFFKLYSNITSDEKDYSFGAFDLSTNMDYEAIINTLQVSNTKREVIKVTFPEGMNVLEMANLLEQNGVCTTEDFFSAIQNFDNYSERSFMDGITRKDERYYILEGYLFPDTYDFYRNEKGVRVIEKLLNNFENKISNEVLAAINDTNYTVDQILTLASIIQKEAANEEDMYNVSSVFRNRLERGLDRGIVHLDSDATVFYPYRNKESVPANLASTFESIYDTYSHQGLSVGPIANPGMDAIMAAINPNNTNYFYFCHDSDGNPYYAETEEVHLQNLKLAGLA